MKKVYYLLPSGKIINEIIPMGAKERDLVVIRRFKVNEAGAVIG